MRETVSVAAILMCCDESITPLEIFRIWYRKAGTDLPHPEVGAKRASKDAPKVNKARRF
jgi:hypothetical protein